MIKHTKPYGIYHWDTFEDGPDATFLVCEADTLQEAEKEVHERYKGRIASNGADQVDIVDLRGNIVAKFKVC